MPGFASRRNGCHRRQGFTSYGSGGLGPTTSGRTGRSSRGGTDVPLLETGGPNDKVRSGSRDIGTRWGLRFQFDIAPVQSHDLVGVLLQHPPNACRESLLPGAVECPAACALSLAPPTGRDERARRAFARARQNNEMQSRFEPGQRDQVVICLELSGHADVAPSVGVTALS